MNYFDLFEIPVQLKVDTSALSCRFFELSRQYHPDYFVQGGDALQAEALEKSALLNKAWNTFRNTDATIKYVLQEKGLLQEDEKYELAPEFLMEVMDINEAIMDTDEGDGGDGGPGLVTKIEALEKEIYEPVREVVENYAETRHTDDDLLKVKEWYYQKKYLDRIRRQLAGMA